MKPSLLLLSIVLLAAGCSSNKAQINFTTAEKHGNVYQKFPGAYISSSRDGEYDVVLVNDALRLDSKHGSSKKPLQPLSQPVLQQAIHIHIFWKPSTGAMIKESSITNAIVHWYVFGNDGARGVDMLHYEGAAFVMLRGGDNKPSLTIGDGEISPRLVKGDLTDPIGPSRITGTISATRDDARVKELLAMFQAKANRTEPTWTQADVDNESAFGR